MQPRSVLSCQPILQERFCMAIKDQALPCQSHMCERHMWGGRSTTRRQHVQVLVNSTLLQVAGGDHDTAPDQTLSSINTPRPPFGQQKNRNTCLLLQSKAACSRGACISHIPARPTGLTGDSTKTRQPQTAQLRAARDGRSMQLDWVLIWTCGGRLSQHCGACKGQGRQTQAEGNMQQ